MVQLYNIFFPDPFVEQDSVDPFDPYISIA